MHESTILPILSIALAMGVKSGVAMSVSVVPTSTNEDSRQTSSNLRQMRYLVFWTRGKRCCPNGLTTLPDVMISPTGASLSPPNHKITRQGEEWERNGSRILNPELRRMTYRTRYPV